MSKQSPNKPIFKVGEYWIGQRKNSPNYYRVWWDPDARRIRRASLSTTDFEEAKLRLKDWFAKAHLPQNEPLNSIPLATIIRVYYEEHAMNLPSHEAARIELTKWLEYFKDQSVAEATTPQSINAFIKSLLESGKSPNYVNRILSSGRAAINRAYKMGTIQNAPFIATTPTGDVPPKGRPLSLDEMRAIYHTTEHNYLKRFILWMAGTVARPDAILELHLSQIDEEYGLVHLNPPGRAQTKKYRPTVRLLNILKENTGEGPFLLMNGDKRRQDMKYAWRKVRKALAFDNDVVPYSIRHSLTRHLRAAGVDAWQVSAQLGHKQPGMSTTEIYAPFDPNYLSGTSGVLEKYLEELTVSPTLNPITCSKHAHIEARREAQAEGKSLKTMVRGTRFELVTPTMST